MKRVMSIMATPFVLAIVTAISVIQPACTGIYHEPEMPKEMMK